MKTIKISLIKSKIYQKNAEQAITEKNHEENEIEKKSMKMWRWKRDKIHVKNFIARKKISDQNHQKFDD